MTHTLNSDRSVAVAIDTYWLPMSNCPKHVKLLLLGIGGVASIGEWDGRNRFWQGWCPLPKKPEWMTDHG
jgi:hypothetical protein